MHKLYIVGIGPGNYEQMTIRAAEVLKTCDVIVGYTVYIDLIREHLKEATAFPRACNACKIPQVISVFPLPLAGAPSRNRGIFSPFIYLSCLSPPNEMT